MADQIKLAKSRAEKSVRAAKSAAPAGGPVLPALDVVEAFKPEVVARTIDDSVAAAVVAVPTPGAAAESATSSETAAAVVSAPVAAFETANKTFPSFEMLMKGMTKMTDTTAFNASTEKAQAMFGDFNERAKTAAEKGSKFVEELAELTKGNIEAIIASGKIAAKGAEDISAEAAAYSKASFEKTTGALKSFTAIKSPAELLQVQSEFAKSQFDSLVAETSKLTESYVKLATEVMQPLSSRFAVAAEKLKSTAV